MQALSVIPRSSYTPGPNVIDLHFDPATGTYRDDVTPFRKQLHGRTPLGPQRQLGPGTPGIPWSGPPANNISMLRRASSALKTGARAVGPLGIALELAFAPAIAAGGAITGAAQWGAPTGLEEDYVGGAVYGGVRGIGAGAGAAAGGIGASIGGAAIGAAVGGPFAPITAAIGAVVGGIGGNLLGESIGSKMLREPARRLGMGARAIVRTARATDRIQFGGNFVDSRGAFTMRQNAVREMSGSMLNARQYLGNEAIFLHER